MREVVRARVDRDIEALHLRERGTRRADVDAEVEHQLVDVDRRSRVPLHVALVGGAEEPGVDARPRARCLDCDAEVGDGLVDARDVERLRAALVHRWAHVVRRRAKRRGRAAVRGDAVRSVHGVAELEALEPLRLQPPELRPSDEELVGNLARHLAAPQQDEAVVLAGRGVRAAARDRDEVCLAAGRDEEGRRHVERRTASMSIAAPAPLATCLRRRRRR